MTKEKFESLKVGTILIATDNTGGVDKGDIFEIISTDMMHGTVIPSLEVKVLSGKYAGTNISAYEKYEIYEAGKRYVHLRGLYDAE